MTVCFTYPVCRKLRTHLLAFLGFKGENRNPLACLRTAGSYFAITYCTHTETSVCVRVRVPPRSASSLVGIPCEDVECANAGMHPRPTANAPPLGATSPPFKLVRIGLLWMKLEGHQDPSKRLPIFLGTQEANVQMVPIYGVPISRLRTVSVRVCVCRNKLRIPLGRERTVRSRGMGTGISEASKRVPIFDRGTGSKPERLRSGFKFLQADLSLIV